MSEQRQIIQISRQQFKNRFKVLNQLFDPFGRHYFVTYDKVRNKRAIYKHYLSQTAEQQEAIYDNLQNYIRLSQHQGISKILVYTRLIEQQEVLAAFQYDQQSLQDYLEKQQFLAHKQGFYMQLLRQMGSIMRRMSQIGIDLDQLNYGNIIVQSQNSQLNIKFFYDQREKTFDNIIQGVKTFTSLDKLRALIYGTDDDFLQTMQSQEGISAQNVYQLGLLMIDLMYRCESKTKKDDGLVRDRPVSRLPQINQEKSYYVFDHGIIRLNEDYLEYKVGHLMNSSTRIIKQITILAQSMIAKIGQRVSLQDLFGQIDRLQKIYRDSMKKTLRSISGENQDLNSSQNLNITKKNNNDFQNVFTQDILKSQRKQNKVKNTVQNSQNNHILEQRRPFDQTAYQNVDIATQMERSRQISSNLTVSNLQQQYHLQNDKQPQSGTKCNQEYQVKPASSVSTERDNQTKSNTLRNTKETLNQNSYIHVNHSLNQNFIQQLKCQTNNIQYSQQKKVSFNIDSNQKNLDVSNQRPHKVSIPKDTILTNIKAHQSIKATLKTILNQIENLYEIRKKQYYDNSIYYGIISPHTNKRTGLGVYLYPSGDVYFGTWLENQLVDGTYIFKNGQSYEGTVKNGKQGWGRYRYSNGNVYEGQWKDDIKEGKGTMWYPNMDKYEGQWMKGKKNGWGKYYYNNGTLYQGNFVNGRKQGFGTIIFSNGTKIQANWQQTHIEGQGKVFYPNGDIFEGQYQLSQKSGKGLYVWSDKTKYDGQFKKDYLDGEARIYFTSKEYYFGRIRNGKRQGQGNYVYENGDSFNGQWKNDMKLIGYYKFKNGDQFEGKFKDNQLNFGLLKYTNGEIYEGEFKNGYRHGVGTYKDVYGQVVCQGHWENDDFISVSQ